MSKNGFFSRLRRLETQDVADFSAEEVHVLAVDDSLVDRKVIERLLRITSCKVTAVDSGRRALQFLGLDDEDENENENENPSGFDVGLKVDLVITDYCMPEMTGYDLLKKIKGSSNLREIPVVIMSSENVLARIDRCLEEGAEEFLVKPVKLADVERLKNYMFGGSGKVQNNQDSGGVNKRKLQETTSDVSVSPSPSPSPPSSPSPDNTSSSPTPSPPPTSSPNSPISFSSMPCSPTSRDSWFNNDTNELKKKIF